MKNLLFALAAGLTFASCSSSTENKTETATTEATQSGEAVASTADGKFYGQEFEPKGFIQAAELDKALGNKDSLEVLVKGEIIQVCQAKGCWITVKTAQDTMMVRFGDEEYFLPKDISGKTVILDGLAYKEVNSVATLRHYAEDAGASDEAIAKITQPDTTLTFNARGVLVYN